MAQLIDDLQRIISDYSARHPISIEELIARLPVVDPFMPHMISYPNDKREAFGNEGRYAVITYEQPSEIAEIRNYLLDYHHRATRSFERRHSVHPFGDVERFALIYRHVPFFWPDRIIPAASFSWSIPTRLCSVNELNSKFLAIDFTNYDHFLEALRGVDIKTVKPRQWFKDQEFNEDVWALGSHIRVVFRSNTDICLEADYKGNDPDWETKWTLLKLRWT